MHLINYIFKKISLSLILCLALVFPVFFVFSLFGYLEENYPIDLLIKLSFISSMEILTVIPIFLFSICIVLLITILLTKKEHLIISHYLPKYKLFMILIPFIILFVFIEIYKNQIIEFLEYHKNNELNISNNYQTNLIVNKKINNNIYYLVNNSSNKIESFNSFEFENKKILNAIYSNNLEVSNNGIILKDYYQLLDNKINQLNNSIYYNLEKLKDNSKNYINLFGSFILIKLIILLLTLMLISKNYLFNKDTIIRINLGSVHINSLFIIFYVYIVLNLNPNIFETQFHILSISILLLNLIKNK